MPNRGLMLTANRPPTARPISCLNSSPFAALSSSVVGMYTPIVGEIATFWAAARVGRDSPATASTAIRIDERNIGSSRVMDGSRLGPGLRERRECHGGTAGRLV